VDALEEAVCRANVDDTQFWRKLFPARGLTISEISEKKTSRRAFAKPYIMTVSEPQSVVDCSGIPVLLISLNWTRESELGSDLPA